MKNGFTIIEVMVAIFIITTGMLGAFNLIQQTIFFTATSSSRLVAAYLAQEGIEIVRNIRDSNWLEEESDWDEGINAISDYRIDYQSLEFPDTTCSLGAGNYLKYNGSLYNCSSGLNSRFKRKIIVSKPSDDMLEVSVLVEWQERGAPHQVTAQENLYNWR